MSNYFEKIERVIREKNIKELDIWNMDETRFWISCEKAQLIVTIDLNKLFHMIYLDNHNYITSIEYIDSANKIILLMLLVSGVNTLSK